MGRGDTDEAAYYDGPFHAGRVSLVESTYR